MTTHSLVAARIVIAWRQKRHDSLKLIDWFQVVREILVLEKLTLNLEFYREEGKKILAGNLEEFP